MEKDFSMSVFFIVFDRTQRSMLRFIINDTNQFSKRQKTRCILFILQIKKLKKMILQKNIRPSCPLSEPYMRV